MATVKTTVNVEDQLYRLVKMRAAEEGTTVAALVDRGLRLVLDIAQPGGIDISLPLLPSAGGLQPGVNLNDRAALLDLMDEGVPVEQRR